MNYLIYSKKIWYKDNIKLIKKKTILKKRINFKYVNKINPKIIFFVHWSEMIPKRLYNNFLCIQFHSSNLPSFRGGSPIQNQIIKGLLKTKISAFKVEKRLDSGKICLKRNLSLAGNANDIYKRMEKMSFQMIKNLISKKKINFYRQKGFVSSFSRRKPEQSNIGLIKKPNFKKLYNFIRMLDADGYPKAFISFKGFKILLEQIKINKKILNGKFKIIKK